MVKRALFREGGGRVLCEGGEGGRPRRREAVRYGGDCGSRSVQEEIQDCGYRITSSVLPCIFVRLRASPCVSVCLRVSACVCISASLCSQESIHSPILRKWRGNRERQRRIDHLMKSSPSVGVVACSVIPCSSRAYIYHTSFYARYFPSRR